MPIRVTAVGKPNVPPCPMPERFRHDVTYFMTPPGDRNVPDLPKGEYWIHTDRARQWLADGVLTLISPLDSTKTAEVEISEEQETWLEWLLENEIERIRLE